MGVLNVAELEPDMILADDLRNPYGRFLLAKGTKLSSKHLRVFKMWGVIEVNISGVSQDDVDQKKTAHLDPKIIQKVNNYLRQRFYYTDLAHPFIKKLFDLCSIRQAEKMSESDEAPLWEPEDSVTIAVEHYPERLIGKIVPHQLLKDEVDLPSLPIIYGQINETVKNPTSSAKDIGKIISKDTSLSVRLLKLVNSSFYGFPSKIDTLSRAVTIVGIKQLSTLALGASIMNVFNNIPSNLIDMRSFWEHSIACGICARIIGNHKNHQNSERLFVAGLLHDVGRLILYSYKPIHAKNVLLRARMDNDLLCAVESEILGFDHAQIGGLILKKWQLPLSLENMVKYHHAPQLSNDPLDAAIIHLSDIITNAVGMGTSGERFVPPLSEGTWQCLDMSSNILELTANQIDRQIEEIKQFLFSNE